MPSQISIHALLAESDAPEGADIGHKMNFYPRSPCGERHLNLPSRPIDKNISIHALLAESDAYTMTTTICIASFLSTLSLRRATQNRPRPSAGINEFYPRSPCGERPVGVFLCYLDNIISIHALLAESDGGSGVGSWPRVIFLSTLSLRRATVDEVPYQRQIYHFYPRSPCGERLFNPLKAFIILTFLSTLSLRRATLSR